ncbi:MAG: AAA family ATPase [Thermoguttaceae bacterium]
MKPKLLPIGRQDFKTLIEDDCIYVDKTEHVYNLITSDKYYFLSRPRRFGKSLLVTTMRYLFLGEKELFKNLFIYNTDWNFDKYPVLDFSFNNMPYGEIGLRRVINERLQRIAKNYDVDVYHEENGCFFELLINALYEKYNRKVVILIDEYDKPILENLENNKLPIAYENRDILRGFYGAIKSNDHAIQFFFMTGVSKFSQLSIFSQLNNLTDLTLDSDYATICGFTEAELKTDFGYYVDRAQETFNGTLWETLRNKYNGFSWNGKDSVYNPFSYLQFLRSRSLDNYWIESGSSKFLTDILRDRNYDLTKIRRQEATQADLLSFDFEKLSIVSLMFQTGYLTIKEKISGSKITKYLLDFPNNEVNECFTKVLLATYTDSDRSMTTSVLSEMREALRSNDFDEFICSIKSLFASIPHQIIVNFEAYFHSIFFAICHLLGFEIDCEVSVAGGRVDAIIQTEKYVHVIEFKINATPKTAIAQIVKNQYVEKFVGDKREVILAGVCFNTKKKVFSHQCVSQNETRH